MNREDRLRTMQGERLAIAREAAGFRSARAAALENDWPESSYRAHENGTRTIGLDDAERYAARFQAAGVKVTAKSILFDEQTAAPVREPVSSFVAVVGYVGAGAEIRPEFEQVPDEGLERIELPFEVPEDLAALKVVGDSMLPAYKDGDAILVWKEQRRATETFYGEEAAVRTKDGRRFLKEIQQGSSKGLFDLHSHNAKLIRGVRLEWIGEIYIIIRASQIRRAHATRKGRVTRAKRAREQETEGMTQLPLRETAR